MGAHEIGGWIVRYSMQYLANSLWQLPLLTAAGWMVSRIARRLGSELQHRVWVATLILSVLTPLGGLRHGTARAVVQLSAAPAVSPQHAPGSIAGAWGVLSLPPLLYWTLFFGYLAFFLCASVRLGFAYRRARDLRRNATAAGLTEAAAEIWQECRRAFTVRDAEILFSSSIAGPATVGDRKPCLLLPALLLRGSSREDLLAAVAHECAHVERRDFLLNLLYQAASLPVAFHPAMWVVKTRIAGTRELICDGMAASRIAGAYAYAHSLLRLTAAIGAEARALPPYAIGMFDANTLENRIMSLTQISLSTSRGKKLTLLLTAAALLSASGLAALAFTVSVAPASNQQAGTAEPPIGKIYKIGDGIAAPKLLHAPDPEYTEQARHARYQGVCVVSLIVDAQGNPRQVRVARHLGMGLDQKAVEAVRRYKFSPALRDGKPVAVAVKIEVNFRVGSGSFVGSGSLLQSPSK